jgi:cohesin complex subunit SCC1
MILTILELVFSGWCASGVNSMVSFFAHGCLASQSGMRKDLNKLQYRTYDIVPHPTVHNIELQGQPDMPETIAVDTDNVSISGAKESATLDHQLHMVLPDGTQLDAMPQEATAAVDPTPQEATDAVYPTPQEATDAVDGTAAFGFQMPSDDHVNNIEKVTESLFGDGKETPLVNETSFDANIPAQDDILDKDGRQDISADLQRNTNADTPLFVLDDTTHDSATRVTDAPDVVLDSSSPARAQAVDDLNREQREILHSDINVFEDKEMPTSEITGLEFAQNASAFPQPTEDENAVSAMGENSGLQENNAGSFVDMDNMGHDFALKECSVSPCRSFY